MSYRDNEDFKSLRLIYHELEEKIDDIYLKCDSEKSLSKKLILLKQLSQALVEFDGHLNRMIEEFPDYYQDKKENLDRIMDKTNKFLYSTLNFITELEQNGAN